jgi:hypothetical protein
VTMSAIGTFQRLCFDRITSAVGVRADFFPSPRNQHSRPEPSHDEGSRAPFGSRERGACARGLAGSDMRRDNQSRSSALWRRLWPSPSPAKRVSRTRRPGSNLAGAKQPRPPPHRVVGLAQQPCQSRRSSRPPEVIHLY